MSGPFEPGDWASRQRYLKEVREREAAEAEAMEHRAGLGSAQRAREADRRAAAEDREILNSEIESYRADNHQLRTRLIDLGQFIDWLGQREAFEQWQRDRPDLRG